MASAWTESGFNWGDLSRSSIRDVVRELYIAVSERDFWVRYFGSGGFAEIGEIEPIDYDATQRHRTKDQVHFIVSALSNWLSESSAPTQIGSNVGYAKLGYRGCFIDFDSGSNYNYTNYGDDADYINDYYAPIMSSGTNILIEDIQLGYESFGKKQTGNLENILNVDLSFIRAYDVNESFRFTYEMMETVFKVLNYLTFVRRCTWRDGGYLGKPSVIAISNFNTALMNQGIDFVGDTFEAQRDNLYNSIECYSDPNSYTYNPLLNIYGRNVYNPSVESWDMEFGGTRPFACTFNNFNILGLDGNTFGTDFFDHKSAIYNLSYSYDFFNDISYAVNFSLPSRPLGHTIRDNALTQLSNETNGGSNGNININVNPQGTWVENGFGRIVDGEIQNSVQTAPEAWGGNVEGKFIEQCMPMINFNKEGFLKYYTEQPN